MPAEQAALLNAIIQNPQEDTPRLVYADWLQENEQPDRAEFIRLQIEQENAIDLEVYDSLADRSVAMALDFEKQWAAEFLGRAVYGVGFRRGFVEEIYSTATAFIRRGAAWAARTPLREVHLTAVAGRGAKLAACEHLAGITNLSICDDSFADDDFRHLALSPYAGGIRSLHLGGPGYPPGIPPGDPDRPYRVRVGDAIRTLARAKFRSQLTSLQIETQERIAPGALAGLLQTGDFPELWDFYLSGGRIGDEGALAVAACPGLGRLEYLYLGANDLSDAALVALLSSTRLPVLYSLALGYNHLTSGGLEQIAALALPPHLTLLSLRGNFLGEVNVDSLVQLCRRNTNLHVDLCGCGIPAEQQDELLQSVPDTLCLERKYPR